MERLELHDPRWLDFVRSSPGAGPFHHPAWAQAVCACYGFRPFALAVRGRDGLAAGLPVAEVGGTLRPRRWVSLPFTDACAPLAVREDARTALVAGLRRAATEERLARVEVRAPVASDGWHDAAVAVTHTLALQADAAALRRTFHRSQVQRNIARAEREGVVVRRAEDARGLTHVFYDLHARTRRRQGVPVQPRRFFELLWERVIERGLGFVLLAEHGGRTLAGAVFLHWNGTLVYKFGASDADALALRPNHLVMWSAIRWGCENGFDTLDLGRTDLDNGGLRSFKRGWAAREEPLVYASCGGAEQRRAARSPGALANVIRHGPPWVGRLVGAALYRYAA